MVLVLYGMCLLATLFSYQLCLLVIGVSYAGASLLVLMSAALGCILAAVIPNRFHALAFRAVFAVLALTYGILAVVYGGQIPEAIGSLGALLLLSMSIAERLIGHLNSEGLGTHDSS